MQSRLLSGTLFIVLLGSSASAEDWAVKMFEGKTTHNFHYVVRGSKAEHRFKLKNIYKKDVHIASVRSSCGCTVQEVLKHRLKSVESTEIIAKFQTRNFTGYKGATVTVTFDEPYYAKVYLKVSGYIRSDIVVKPESINFGTVDQGSEVTKELQIEYTGNSTWKILDIRSANKYLEAQIKETGRANNKVQYTMELSLTKDAPAGYIRELVTVLTNDQRAKRFPIEVTARVTPAVTVSPAALFLGKVEPGKTITKQFIVKGKKPFKIIKIKCDDASFEFKMGSEAKTIHIIPVTFTAPEKPGKFNQKIFIETDLEGNVTPSFKAFVQVVKP